MGNSVYICVRWCGHASLFMCIDRRTFLLSFLHTSQGDFIFFFCFLFLILLVNETFSPTPNLIGYSTLDDIRVICLVIHENDCCNSQLRKVVNLNTRQIEMRFSIFAKSVLCVCV